MQCDICTNSFGMHVTPVITTKEAAAVVYTQIASITGMTARLLQPRDMTKLGVIPLNVYAQ